MEITKEDLPKKGKKKSTSKSIIIDGKLHSHMKSYCVGNNRKMGRVIEDLIKLYLNNPKEVENQIDNLKDKQA